MRTPPWLNKDYLVLVFCSMAIALSFAYLFSISGEAHFTSNSFFGGLREAGMAIVLALLGVSGTTLLYTLLIKNREFEARLILGAIFGPTVGVLVVIVSEAILLGVAKQTNATAVALIIVSSLYISIFSVIFIVTGSISRRTRNIVYVIYGSVIAGFIGIGLSSITLVVVLVIVAAYDLLITRSQLMASIIGDPLKESAMRRFAYKSDALETGIGDFMFNSSLPAHVYAHFTADIFVLTIALIVVGYLINLRIAFGKRYVGGISAPTFLGVIPTLAILISSVA